jgi:hypothetical protein
MTLNQRVQGSSPCAPRKDGAPRVELHGDIARLITVDRPMGTAATKTERAASGGAARPVLSVVAGARNHLNLLLTTQIGPTPG